MASTPTVSLASTMAFTDALNSGANRLKSIFSRSSKKLHPSRIISEENLARYCPGGYHPVRIGDLFNNGKYKIVSKLGYGVYSTVWLACNLETKRHVALKVLTADSFGHQKDTFELDILKRIKAQHIQHAGNGHILGLLDDFEHHDIKPQNIVVESPAINSMFEQTPSEAFRPRGSPLEPPNDFYMASTQLSSTEEDIAHPTELSIRLADFGTSSWFDKHLTEWIQPQMLRAPEVILGADWDYKVDIWNLGLVVSLLAFWLTMALGK
ncbi:hypothetical protein VD0001_g463 [Verticillium dahliae]|nr:hypothetical protein VD0001_g463 [Verticillium dahliae]